MYKYEITADSLQELQAKQAQLARMWLNENSANELINKSNNVSNECYESVKTPETQAVDHTNPTTNIEAAPALDNSLSTEVDSRGLPWDARIHAATKVKNKDDSWRYKRGASDELIKQVEQELIAKIKSGQVVQVPVAVGAPVMVVPPPPAPTVPVAMPVFNPAPALQVVPPVAAAPVATYETAAMPTGNRPAYTLSAFKNHLTELLASLANEGKIDQAYIQSLKDYFKVKEIWNVIGNEKQAMELWSMFGSPEVGFITKIEG